MFAVITVEKSLEVRVIPVHWIKGFDLISSINHGVNCAETHVVFYCDDTNKQPNFSAPIFASISSTSVGCYLARINKFFGKMFCLFLKFSRINR